MAKIRVLVVDDSDFQRGLITGILESDPQIEIAGQAKDGLEAVEKTLELKPDVITMDIQMPVMGGLEATRQIMAQKPTPIVIVSVTILDEQKFAFTCMNQGALDFVPVGPQTGIVSEELIAKVKLCSRIKVVTHPLARKHIDRRPAAKKAKFEIVGIAVSTGGPPALQAVLSELPQDFPVPIVIVQHISKGFTAGLAEWLNGLCKIKIKEAHDAEELKPGVVYLAPSDCHLIVNTERKIELLEKDFLRTFHKPSADVMLNSLAEVYGPACIGVIMTGMGKDGAGGIRAIKKVGGMTLAQDEATSLIYGMNKAAIEEGSVEQVLALNEIASTLVELVS